MGGNTTGTKGPITGINVTPMVDVVLVLLVIMMVSSNYIVSKSLKVELPKAASGSDVSSVAAVTIAKDGTTYYNQQPMTEPQLIGQFKTAYAGNPDISLIVSADNAVQHGKVVHIIDLAKIEGIVKFAINVESLVK